MGRQSLALLVAVAGCLLRASGTEPPPLPSRASLRPPLHFERGSDASTPFIGHAGHQIYRFDSQGQMYLDVHPPGSVENAVSIRMMLVAANLTPVAELSKPLKGKVNYLVGPPENWRTDVATFGALWFRDVYPGIDLVYRGRGGRLEYDFHLAPQARPETIRLRFEGLDPLRVDEDGDLVLRAGKIEIRQRRPRIYQTVGGVRRTVEGGYRLDGPREVGFTVGQYDAGEALVIDPEVSVFRYLGGASDDRGYGIAVDNSGNVYVTGETWAGVPATTGAYQAASAGNSDVFVTKLSADGSSVIYSTYLGGTLRDSAKGIAVDSSGCAYVTGYTLSKAFPVTSGAWRTSSTASAAVFVTKLNAAGTALVYSTLVGGTGADYATAIAVDSSGNAHVAGYTTSRDFSTSGSGVQTAYGGGYYDGFVFKLNSTGTALLFSTYLGGSSNDVANALALDSSGNVYVAGSADSSDFPQQNATSQAGSGTDAFVTKLSAAGTIVYSSRFGGRGLDIAYAVAATDAGVAYVAGTTSSIDFPVTSGVYQTSRKGDFDAFVAAFDPGARQLSFSTYLGGTGSEEVRGMARDGNGRLCLAGWTNSGDFPGQSASARDSDGFYAVLSADGASLAGSVLLGGSSSDMAQAVALTSVGVAYITGFTLSSNASASAARTYGVFSGGVDVFVTKIGATATAAAPVVAGVTPSSGSGSSQTFTVQFSDANGYSDISWAAIIINSQLNGNNACYLYYDRALALLGLYSDTAKTFLWMTVGTSSTLSNDQCSVTGASASFSGNYVYLSLPLTFKASFAGAKTVYVYVQDTGGLNPGTVGAYGSWTVPGANAPTVVGVTPNSGSGSSQTFTFQFSDADGYADVSWAAVIINASLDGNNACYLYYDRAMALLGLYSDTAKTFLWMTVGSSSTLSNDQCSVTGASASFSGTSVYLTVPITFRASFAGTKTIYAYVQDNAGMNPGTVAAKGTWSVPGANAPTVVGVTPNSGGGNTQTFVFQFSDADGYADISWAAIIINSELNGNNACYLYYDRAAALLGLYSDTAKTFLWMTVGSSSTLSNDQCSVTGASASFSGTSVYLTVPITFKVTFAGTKTIYAYVQDNAGMNPGTVAAKGTWTISGANAPTAVGVTPSSGSGSSQSFVFQFSDADGYADVSWAAVIINSELNGNNACYLYYDRAAALLGLYSDTSAGFLWATVGSSTTLSNNQCTVAGASASFSGTSVYLTVPITFKTSFSGIKNIYMYVQDRAGMNPGSVVLRGQWTVP